MGGGGEDVISNNKISSQIFCSIIGINVIANLPQLTHIHECLSYDIGKYVVFIQMHPQNGW